MRTVTREHRISSKLSTVRFVSKSKPENLCNRVAQPAARGQHFARETIEMRDGILTVYLAKPILNAEEILITYELFISGYTHTYSLHGAESFLSS